MRLGLPLACALLLTAAVMVVAPTASACTIANEGSPQSQTFQHTASVDGTTITFGATVTHDEYGSSGQPCQAIATVKSLPPTGVTPIFDVSP
jgi:hypothetical protein